MVSFTPPPVYPRAGDHATDCTGGRVGPTTSQHVPQKDTKPYLCQTSTMSVHISLTRVSQNCGPFCLLCLDLQTEIYICYWQTTRQFQNAAGVGPTALTVWVCAAWSWVALWRNSLTDENYCIQCNTECYTGVGHDISAHHHSLFLGAFAILQKVTISLVMSVRLPACLSICPSAWNNSAPTGWIFMKFSIWLFFKYLQEN